MNPHQTFALTSRSGTNDLLRRRTAVTRTTFVAAAIMADVAIIVTMAALTGIGYHLLIYSEVGDVLSYLEVGLLAAAIFVIPNLFRGEYDLPNFFSFKPHLRRSIRLWNVTFICLLALGFFTQVSGVYSRAWITLFYALTIGVLLSSRYLFVCTALYGSRAGLMSAQRIFLVGTGRQIEDFVTRYRPRTFGVSVIGCHFLTPPEPRMPAQARRELLTQDLDQVVNNVRLLEPEAVFLLIPWSATETINRCTEALLTLPAEIHLGPEHVLDRFGHMELSKLGPIASLKLTRLPLTRFELLQKRLLDLFFASIALLLATPLFVVVALLIKLDSRGPIFFLQHRYGFNQKPFRIIKFRTMSTLDDGPVINQATPNDPRVTRVGYWLRRWNLDEIPQVFNVISGDMSLVGPRPHALSHNRDYEQRISLYARRHNVKPGITGWAQIHGFRGETDTDDKMQKRVDYDLHYIDNWSVWLDLQILLRTVFSPKSYRNAY
jgi:Undecaprenyl-phosphate glucose phosphotransferase